MNHHAVWHWLGAWVCWFHCRSLGLLRFVDCVVSLSLLCLIVGEEVVFCWVSNKIESVRLDFNLKEIDFYGLYFNDEFNGLDLAFQNRVYCTRDVSFLNSFENMLTNKIIWKSMLFWKKKKPIFRLFMFNQSRRRIGLQAHLLVIFPQQFGAVSTHTLLLIWVRSLTSQLWSMLSLSLSLSLSVCGILSG